MCSFNSLAFQPDKQRSIEKLKADETTLKELRDGFERAYIDSDSYTGTNLAYKPEFVSNNPKSGRRVLVTIEDALSSCDKFYISVAFVKETGIEPLLPIFLELEKKGIKGEILTTNYLTFSEPKAIKRLLEFKNLRVRIFDAEASKSGFHTKGYIFHDKDLYRIIIGSSNITSSALSRNMEWNTELVSTEEGEIAKDILSEYNALWNSRFSHDAEKYLETYENLYNTKQEIIREQKRLAKEQGIVSVQRYELKPNSMQTAFITNLRSLYEMGEERALLISATGTGKTYASAFAMRDLEFKRVLFLVHRNRIVNQAESSYQDVFCGTVKTGFLGDGRFDKDADFIFATRQTLSKEENLKKFSPDFFDAIVIDEAHHSLADTYQNIMDYFKPRFWLGMTATPDKRDDDKAEHNVYEIFNYNIAYEIRLQQALNEDLLCDFHYFGITDIEGVGDTKKAVNKVLTSDARVDYVMKQAAFYGYSGERVKGLIFCSRIDEAEQLSDKFNTRGWRTAVLSSKITDEGEREELLERLVGPEGPDALDYILSVDILSEGVDLPEINQVIMLRPTQSPIVFIQQLGRGLRKNEEKQFVVVLDFIGNYDHNFFIPIALSGDRTYSKDRNRRFLMEGCRYLPGGSTIHFDEIAKQRIYDSINKSRGIAQIMKDGYFDLKYRLNRIPSLMDFYSNGSIDPELIIDKYGSYYAFLKVVEKDYNVELSEKSKTLLDYYSNLLIRAKRPHEIVMLKALLSGGNVSLASVADSIKREFARKASQEELQSALWNVSGLYYSKKEDIKKNAVADFGEFNKLSMDNLFLLRVSSYIAKYELSPFAELLSDTMQVAWEKCSDLCERMDTDEKFALYEKYSRRDICYLLNSKQDRSSTMYGMSKIGDDTCIFVTYKKKGYVDGKPDYADRFDENRQLFYWDSKIGQGPDGAYMKNVEDAKRRRLFVQKDDDEGQDFYYVGQVDLLKKELGTKNDNNGRPKKITKVVFKMQTPIRNDLYEYFEAGV